jgi:hypothetical protein
LIAKERLFNFCYKNKTSLIKKEIEDAIIEANISKEIMAFMKNDFKKQAKDKLNLVKVKNKKLYFSMIREFPELLSTF